MANFDFIEKIIFVNVSVLKNISVITILKLIPLKFVKNLSPFICILLCPKRGGKARRIAYTYGWTLISLCLCFYFLPEDTWVQTVSETSYAQYCNFMFLSQLWTGSYMYAACLPAFPRVLQISASPKHV